MRDTIIRGLIIITMLALMTYIIYLLSQGAVIVPGHMAAVNNHVVYIVMSLIILFLLIAYGLYPIAVPRQRVILFFLGVFLILFPQVMMQDYPAQGIYLADILKITGVILLIVGPTGIILSRKIVKKQEESKVEIIEV